MKKTHQKSYRELTKDNLYGFISFKDAQPRPHEHIIVTNNIGSRDAFGRMSHIWLTSFVQPVKEPGQSVEWITFADNGQRIHQLSHWKYVLDLDVIDIIDPRRTDVALLGTQDAVTRHPDYRKQGRKVPQFEEGMLYETLEGVFVQVLPPQHQGIDTLRCSDGVDRYNRPGDMGRVTGSALDFSYPKNIDLTPITEEYFVEHLQDLIDGCWSLSNEPDAKDYLHMRKAGESFDSILQQIILIDNKVTRK